MKRLLLPLLLLAGVLASPGLAVDSDGDGVEDPLDDCVALANAGGGDADADGYGDRCDCDFDNDGGCSIADFTLFLPDFVAASDSGIGTDMDGSGGVGIADFNLFLPGFQAGVPGPSGLVPDGDGDGISPAGGDCRDGDSSVFPNAPVVIGTIDSDPNLQGLSEGACFDERLPDGDDPIATDGCSAPGPNPNNPTNTIGNFCPSAAFGSGDPTNPLPCDLHDSCFATCGTTRAECDLAFLANMLAVCASLPPSESACVAPCLTFAAAYFDAVSLVDADGYLAGQERNCLCTCEADTSACGNGVCEIHKGETSSSCADCGSLANGEVCVRSVDCASDRCGPRGRCIECGDGTCDWGESCLSAGCQADCGSCATGNACLVDADCAGFCDALSICRATLPNGSVCLKDAACTSGNCSLGFCTANPFCGDLSCNNGETCATCGIDCGICPFCGDFSCNNGETCATCAFDCGDCCQPAGRVCLVGSDCCSGTCSFFTCN